MKQYLQVKLEHEYYLWIIKIPVISSVVNMVRIGLDLRLVRVNFPIPMKGIEKREGKRKMVKG